MTRVQVGRWLALTAMLLAAYGIITLIAIGSLDQLPEGVAMFALVAFGFGALVWLALPRQPYNAAVWIPLWPALAAGLGAAAWATMVVIASRSGLDVSPRVLDSLTPSDLPIAASLVYELVIVGASFFVFPMVTVWLLLFPDGKLPSPRWKGVLWVAVTTMVALVGALLWIYRPSSTAELGATEYGLVDVVYLLLLVISAVCILSLVLRYRRSSGDARPQYRWVFLGTGALYVAVWVVGEAAWQLLVALAAVAFGIVCYGVAVTKYRLYDIDVVISKTVVFGTLAAFIGAVYVLVVVVVGDALGSGVGNLPLAISATALVAIAFEPVRRRAQRWANRLVYGKRATPYEVLSDLTQRLAMAEPAQGMLTRMAKLMAEGTGAEQATVWLVQGEGRFTIGGAWPELAGVSDVESFDRLDGFAVRVLHEAELVGALQVIKGRGNPVSPTERRLLNDLAGSAGLVLGNQRLNAALALRAAELQQSRRRLVEMQDAERRRLERDLHDGAQQQVVAVKLKIGLAEHVARKQGEDQLARQLGELADNAQEAVDDIRALAKGLYPPLLESDDVAAAIKAQAAASSIPVEVESDGIGRYPKNVESAVYFAALEAMTNAAAHGAASRVDVTLRASVESIELDVKDDGAGYDPARTPYGVGLTNIRDRVEALGGDIDVESAPGSGTTLRVRVPLGQT